MTEVDWGRYNLPAIWSLISDVDVCTGSDRVLAWDGLAATMRDQHKRLLTAADGLAAVWPPAKNDSARFFLQQVNGLADSMQETLLKAEDTKAGLQGVIEAFSTAQTKVQDLASGRQGVSNDWMPRFVDHAEDKYDEHAQAAMREAESAIQDHAAQIQAPSLFNMSPTIYEDGHHLKADPGPTGESSSGGSGQTGLHATPRLVPVQRDPSGVFPNSPANSGSDGSGAGGSSDGPILSGLAPTVPGAAGLPAPPLANGPGSGVGQPPGGALPPGVLPFGGGGSVGGLVGGLPGGAGGGVRRPVSVRRAMPSGAVIGEATERGAAGNPRGAAGIMPMGSAGGRGAGRRNADGTVDGQADQQWETSVGVAPVIRPGVAEIRHDPGPGVIGLNR